MSISQSRASSRGPLIAVIKIEIQDDQVDRIFLHQNDDAYKLAEEFQLKHKLNPLFVEHIYQKIKASRQSLQKGYLARTPVTAGNNVDNTQRSAIGAFSHVSAVSPVSGNKTPSPYDRDTSHRNYQQHYEDVIPKYQVIIQDTQQDRGWNDQSKTDKPSNKTQTNPTANISNPITKNANIINNNNNNKKSYQNIYQNTIGSTLHNNNNPPSYLPTNSNTNSNSFGFGFGNINIPNTNKNSGSSSSNIYSGLNSNLDSNKLNSNNNNYNNSVQLAPYGYKIQPSSQLHLFSQENTLPSNSIGMNFQSKDRATTALNSNSQNLGGQAGAFIQKSKSVSNLSSVGRNNNNIGNNNQNARFETFMQHQSGSFTLNKQKQHRELFQKYMRQKNKNNNLHNNSSNQQSKKIQSLYLENQIKMPSNNNNNTFYQSNPFNELRKEMRSSASTSKLMGGMGGDIAGINSGGGGNQGHFSGNFSGNVSSGELYKKVYNQSHYSFNQDKPVNVKVLRRNDSASMLSSKKSLNKQQKQKIAKEVTNRLYNENEIKKTYLNKIKERAKQDKKQKQDKQLTYRPQINKVSSLIAADRYKNMPIQDYLIDYAKRSQMKKQAYRAINAQKEVEGCSFQPQINVISKKLAQDTSSRSLLKLQKSKKSRNKSISHHHHENENQCSRKHCQNQNAFRPSLNKMSEQIIKNKFQGNFQQRLKIFLEQKNSKLNQLTKQKIKRQKIDEQSGQQLFHPRISSTKPLKQRSPKGSQIHQYLYQLSKNTKPIPQLNPKPLINQNSQQIIQQMYMKRIAWLFSQLDSDQDGFISPKRICIDSIDEKILEVIIPVLFQMEEMDIELNLMDFRNAIRNLHPSLNALQKSILYNYSNSNAKNVQNLRN